MTLSLLTKKKACFKLKIDLFEKGVSFLLVTIILIAGSLTNTNIKNLRKR